MMKKIEYVRCLPAILMGGICLCGMMSGCGVRDKAIVIPVDSFAESETTVDNDQSTDTDLEGYHDNEDAAVKQTICVYVCGAVNNPGVVELPEDSRADDALQAAGGFAEEAQRDYVNLAAKVQDGEKLFFPSVTEAKELALAEETEQKGLVNINTADVSTLMTLPGIGESRALDIIAYREGHGAFQAKEDIQKVSGIKESLYRKLCDKIIVQ